MADHKYRWRDVGAREFGARSSEPTDFRINSGLLGISVFRRELGFMPTWTVRCDAVGLCKALTAKTPRAAQTEAIEEVQKKLERMMADLHLMKGAPHVG